MSALIAERIQGAARPAARQPVRVRRWLVSAYCPKTGPWRQYVQARTAHEAVAAYAQEHGMDPRLCSASSD